MDRKTLSAVMLVFCAVSLAIAVYQLVGSRTAEGILSIVFSLVFLMGGLANRRSSGVGGPTR